MSVVRRDPPPPGVSEEIWRLRPWYHDFGRLGLVTDFGDRSPGPREWARRVLGHLAVTLRGAGPAVGGHRRFRLAPRVPSHVLNQRAKEAILRPWLERAVAELGGNASCLELFCADGYYSSALCRLGEGVRALGVDRGEREIDQARAAARALGCERARFERAEAVSWVEASDRSFDLVLCAGGLYHLDDPRRLLAALPRITRSFLVIQTVVTLETERADHFEAPAPGWRHGCRFTEAGLHRWLEELGWRVLEHHRGELPANRRLCDRGSSYVLARVGAG